MSADPWFQSLFAERIGGAGYGKGTDIYKFEKIKRAKRQALAEHPERTLIDFGIGENDGMAPAAVRERMKVEIDKPENRGYADNGIADFKEAAARFMQRTYGVTLDAATQVNHCIGSKPALAMVPACFINPGDVTLMTVPGYPVAGTATRYYGGEVHRLPLLRENGFLPSTASPPTSASAPSSSSSTTRTARPGASPPSTSTSASSTSRARTRSSSFRTPRTGSSPTRASRCRSSRSPAPWTSASRSTRCRRAST
jgi:hypothetical protein